MSRDTKTILVTDDDKMILEAFKDLLERNGYRVLLAENGDIALARLGKEHVDIVLLDILMPQKEGLETLIVIRRQYPDVPVYVMSGGGKRSKHDFLSVAEKFGAAGVLRKPIAPAVVLKLIEEAPPSRASGQR